MTSSSLNNNRYRMRKQWDSIISSLFIPKDIPLKYTKNIKITSEDSSEYISHTPEEFESQINHLSKIGKEVQNLTIEINFEKLIVDVEKKIKKILTL